ncbi:CYTH domain-containing protein [Bacillus thuringiensis]|uniref:CYTH domain-containing protein n=1 Tax=Bacillus thuringiensis TaxID=1428 RepID=UPI003988500A
MATEIERKFLCNKQLVENLINSEQLNKSVIKITQQYLCIGHEEVRIRKKETLKLDTLYFLTIKSGDGLMRQEHEFQIAESTYTQLLGLKQPIIKNRFTLKNQKGLTVIIDKFKDFDFIIGEVEFESEAAAKQYQPEIWMDEEITYNPDFKNQKLWLKLNMTISHNMMNI